MKSVLECRVRECRVESTESERVQSRECRECKGTESRAGSRVQDEITVRGAETRVQCESAESRVQRVQGHRV